MSLIDKKGSVIVKREIDKRKSEAIKSLQDLGSIVTFMCDSTNLKVICDQIDLRYDEENGLQLLSNGVNVAEGAKTVVCEFRKDDFPRIFVTFEPNPIRITKEMLEKEDDNLENS